MTGDLDARILAAHARNDGRALITLLTEAADAAGDLDAACFFLTCAHVYALEAGAPEAADLHARLKAHGREA